jgi:hypothetical protein
LRASMCQIASVSFLASSMCGTFASRWRPDGAWCAGSAPDTARAKTAAIAASVTPSASISGRAWTMVRGGPSRRTGTSRGHRPVYPVSLVGEENPVDVADLGGDRDPGDPADLGGGHQQRGTCGRTQSTTSAPGSSASRGAQTRCRRHRERLTHVARHGGPTAVSELPTPGTAPPSFITFRSGRNAPPALAPAVRCHQARRQPSSMTSPNAWMEEPDG